MPIRIVSINSEPCAQISFLNAGRGPGQFYEDRIVVQEATVSRLPEGLDAIIATADLQGRERFQDSHGGPPRLLGEVLPERLQSEILPSVGLMSPKRIGVILAGDLYTVPALDRRGGSGDVTAVWRAFGDCFAWVVGVAGNHDTFGSDPNSRPRISGNLYYLDGDRITIDGLQIAGIGGIIGNRRKPRRRSGDVYVETLKSVLKVPADLTVMHDGPDAPTYSQRGSASIRELLERRRPGLVVRGHSHWDHALAELSNQIQVLNVDARVVLLRKSGGADR